MCHTAYGDILYTQEAAGSSPALPTTFPTGCEHQFQLDDEFDTVNGMDSSLDVNSPVNTLEEFIASRQGSRGLTPKGKTWLRETLSKFLQWLPVSLAETDAATVITFLSQYDDKPWRKHSMYRALRTYWKWASRTYDIPNPFLDRQGNQAIDAPNTPSKILYTLTPELVSTLIEAAPTVRGKAIVSLLADSGGRRAEIVGIQAADVDLNRRLILVWGKNRKQGWLVFGPTRVLAG